MAKVSKLSGVEFSVHDLRRTFITIAESLEIPVYALKRLLNHNVSSDVTAGYIILRCGTVARANAKDHQSYYYVDGNKTI